MKNTDIQLAQLVINHWSNASYEVTAVHPELGDVAQVVKIEQVISNSQKLDARKSGDYIFFFKRDRIIFDYRIAQTEQGFEMQYMSLQSFNELESKIQGLN
jgi:hypothetical protein